ncbi:MAG: TonB-dependent receptor [Phaeodactylibacter sp.]|nr:TonB-dependent receptor [Phaeodactylibacter sp.]
MKRKSTYVITSALIMAFTLLASGAWAQKGVVSGIVIDEAEGASLPGANIYIEGSGTGTVSDVDGVFLLNNVDPGEQMLIVSFLSFETQRIPVQVEAGAVVTVNVSMAPETIMGEEVIVTAQALGQAKAINQQLNAESIANIVSADRIQELPDVNAAEAIARLPGVAINRSGGEGQKVVIRGMEPKFAAITVNGVSLPSNSGTDRSVDLSLISPELLDGIEVFKSPLPDMDAEAVGGTVNLKLRKAPKELKLLAKALGGFNELNNDYGDYKGVLQLSKRILDNKLGFVLQGGVERFNRSGDFLTNSWRRGATDDSTGVTEILGNTLRLEDRHEIRKRWNGSLSLDYGLGKHNFSFFGLYSKTERDRFYMQERYIPSDPAIEYWGRGIDNALDLYALSLNGEHTLGRFLVDWTLSTSETAGETPYDFTMRFTDFSQTFDPALDASSHPRNYFDAARPGLDETFLFSAFQEGTQTMENTQAAAVNIKLPFNLSQKIDGYLKVGGKYKGISRSRSVERLAEEFYYLGAAEIANAIPLYDGELIFLPDNNKLVSMLSFTSSSNDIEFENESGENIGLNASLDPALLRAWYESQIPVLNKDRSVIVDNYEVEERVSAGYTMLKVNFGKKLSAITGFRYEYSDNEYRSGISSINGRYGVNGFYMDTTTFQQYGEFLPHLHLKYKPMSWFDIRASYAKTLARPDFFYLTPRAQIDNNNTVVTAGNPQLKHAVATNYDVFFSAYKGGFGLLSFGFFYKDVENIFYPWTTNLFDQETADAFGWPNYKGYEFRSFTNSKSSSVYGMEVDLQTNLNFLPQPFSGIVLNINYSRLYSETEVFFLTSETRLVIPVPPIFETTYTNSTRKVDMPSQAPHILRLSVGYDYKKFSARVSGAYQGTKANTYSINKDFDTFTLEFWRWDASFKQRFGQHWSVFLNLNNFTNQQDVSFTREEAYVNTIETYGFTGTFGLQYEL